MRRLVLGCGAVGYPVVEALSELSGDLLVIDPDDDRVEALREENVDAQHADPTDPETIDGLDRSTDLVVVAGDDSAANRAAAEVADDALPDAVLVVYAGDRSTPDEREAMAAVADRLIEPGPAVVGQLLSDVGDAAGGRLLGLTRVLRRIEGRLGVFMHDNPDPDAIGSAIALCELARLAGVEADACYFGEISHQENRALVNLLDLDLRRIAPDGFDPGEYDAVALVDHSRAGVNDQLPAGTPIDVVIDHHPPRAPVEAEFVDLRSDAGATSTLLADYYRRLRVEASTPVATALLYGIRIDTRDFGREITPSDFEAAAFLLPYADVDVLERVESPTVPGDTFDTVARAIRNRRRAGSTLVSGTGAINTRDALAQAADHLLTMEGITATLVFGYTDGTVYISARTLGSELDIGEAVREAFDQIGSAGGHADMAGAQIPLGIIGEVENESLETVVAAVITNRFLEVLDLETEVIGDIDAGVEGVDAEVDDPESADAGVEGIDAEADDLD